MAMWIEDDDGNVVRMIDMDGNVLAEGEDAARMLAKAKAHSFERRAALLEREHPEHPLLAKTVQGYRAQAARLRGTARRAPETRQQPRSREHRSGRTRGAARRSSARSGDSGDDGGGEPEPPLPAHVEATVRAILRNEARLLAEGGVL
jgi:hypothetical protein